jgi:IstB-like ATP binding protein
MIVVAGPPGSGKTRSFPVTAFGVDSFNIDDRCAQILGSYRAIPRDVRRAVAKEPCACNQPTKSSTWGPKSGSEEKRACRRGYFPNATCATALIDRVIHHADVLAIEGESYRLREAEKRAGKRT